MQREIGPGSLLREIVRFPVLLWPMLRWPHLLTGAVSAISVNWADFKRTELRLLT